MMTDTYDEELRTSVERLSRDLANAAATMTKEEARFLVDAYYNMQDNRKRSDNQVRALAETKEPHMVLNWLARQSDILEAQIKRALDKYSAAQPVGQWARSITGIGPVIAAGLLAHIDIEKAPTVGHIWSFAGLEPSRVWGKGQKRPWNAALKVLCWKIGESFVKVQNNVDDVYGKVYAERRVRENRNNDSGLFAEQAKQSLKDKEFGKDTDAYAWYAGCYPAGTTEAVLAMSAEKRIAFLKSIKGEPGSGQPMLPPARLLLRAQRYAVKRFLAHYHEVAYWDRFKHAPPNPYPIGIMGHDAVHKVPPPNFKQ